MNFIPAPKSERFIHLTRSITTCLIGLLCFVSILSAEEKAGKNLFSDIPNIIEEITPDLMAKYRVPGVSIALIGNHEINWLGQYGVTVAGSSQPVTKDTIFEGTS